MNEEGQKGIAEAGHETEGNMSTKERHRQSTGQGANHCPGQWNSLSYLALLLRPLKCWSQEVRMRQSHESGPAGIQAAGEKVWISGPLRRRA